MGAHLGKEGMAEAAAELDLLDLRERVNSENSEDEVPTDIRAFFGHPLASTSNNGDDTHASALALLHEYQHLPAIDKNDCKIGDKYGSLVDILSREQRRDGSHSANNNDYMMLLHDAEVDAFLNRNSHAQDLSLDDDSPQDLRIMAGGEGSPGGVRDNLLQAERARVEDFSPFDEHATSLHAQLEEIKADVAESGDRFMDDIQNAMPLNLEAVRRDGLPGNPQPVDPVPSTACDSDMAMDTLSLDLALGQTTTASSLAKSSTGVHGATDDSNELSHKIEVSNRPHYSRTVSLVTSQTLCGNESSGVYSQAFPSDEICQSLTSSSVVKSSLSSPDLGSLAQFRNLVYSNPKYTPHSDCNDIVASFGSNSPINTSCVTSAIQNDNEYSLHIPESANSNLLQANTFLDTTKQFESENSNICSQSFPTDTQMESYTAAVETLQKQPDQASASQHPQDLSLPPQGGASLATRNGLSQASLASNTGLSQASLASNTGLSQASLASNPGLSQASLASNPGLSSSTSLSQASLPNSTGLSQQPKFTLQTGEGLSNTYHRPNEVNTSTSVAVIGQPSTPRLVTSSHLVTLPVEMPSELKQLVAGHIPRQPVTSNMTFRYPEVISAVTLPPEWHPPLVLPEPTLAPVQNLRPWHPPMAPPPGPLVLAQHSIPFPPPRHPVHPGQLFPTTTALVQGKTGFPPSPNTTKFRPSTPRASPVPPPAVMDSPNVSSNTVSILPSSLSLCPRQLPAGFVTIPSSGSDQQTGCSSAQSSNSMNPPALIPISSISSSVAASLTQGVQQTSLLTQRRAPSASGAIITTSPMSESRPPPRYSSILSHSGMQQGPGIAPDASVTSKPTSTTAVHSPLTPRPCDMSPASMASPLNVFPPPNPLDKPTQRVTPSELQTKQETSLKRTESCEDIDASAHQRASENTKRIIQRLTEKIRRNQLQRQASASGQDIKALSSELHDILQHSMDGEEGVCGMESSSASSLCSTPAGSAPGTPCAQMNPLSQGWPSAQGGPDSPVKAAVNHPGLLPVAVTSSGPTRQRRGSFGNTNYQSLSRTPRGMEGRTPGAMGPVVVISPHGPFQGSTYSEHKSPDSGFNEVGCGSPTDGNKVFVDGGSEESRHNSSSDDCSGRPAKRRRSSSTVKQMCGGGKPNSKHLIPKIDPDLSGYTYIMDAPVSTNQRINEDRITYLNKGQFYAITLQYRQMGRILRCNTVRTNIMVVFRDDKTITDELKSWEFWHSRQHSSKQRILDVDTKNSSGIVANSIHEIAHNAVTLAWNPREQPAKISIAVNCLSTDFSNQKGVKGLPLHVQIDTYEGNGSVPAHRSYCQVKIFCDKGAERKTRDEERRKDAKTKMAEANGRRKVEELFHPPCERSDFYTMADNVKAPVLFNHVPIDDYTTRSSPLNLKLSMECSPGSLMGTEESMLSPSKRARTNSQLVSKEEKILLYVREAHESVFTALLLHSPTLHGLYEAIEEKFTITAPSIKNIYKRCQQGILVKMDDNIIRHYSNESTFIIYVQKQEGVQPSLSTYDITLAEIENELKT